MSLTKEWLDKRLIRAEYGNTIQTQTLSASELCELIRAYQEQSKFKAAIVRHLDETAETGGRCHTHALWELVHGDR